MALPIPLVPAGALLRRHWKRAAGAAVILVLSILLAIRTDQRDDAQAALARERQASALFAARVRAAAEEYSRRFNEQARRVERDQARISQEVSHDYQARIADLRRRAAALRSDPALRLRPGAGRADPGGVGAAGMPGLPGTAGGPDGTAGDQGLSDAERVAATEQAIRLEALQDWVRRQAEAKRRAGASPPTPDGGN